LSSIHFLEKNQFALIIIAKIASIQFFSKVLLDILLTLSLAKINPNA